MTATGPARLILGYLAMTATPTREQLAAQPVGTGPVVRLDFRQEGEPGRAFAVVVKEESWAEVVAQQLVREWQPTVTPPPLAWVMPGSGSLGADYWTELASLDPTLQQVREEAEAYFTQATGETVSFLDLGDETDPRSTHPLYQRPATVTATVAMARLLMRYGIQPNFLAGHSVGELTACHLAGCFDLAELLRLTCAPFRGGALATGAMAALIGPEDRIHELIRQTGVQVVISNRNSPRQLVVSGLAPQIETLVAQAKPAKLKAVPLKVATAFHSPLLVEAHRQYRTALEESTFQPARILVVSGLTGDVLPWSEPFAQTRALLDCAFIGPVNHVAQVRRLRELGAGVIVDLGPSDRLARLAREILEEQGVTVVAANTAKGGGRESFLECIAQLHILGYTIADL
ncbi:acyltransferase domain-containing protein [Candidatus Cyanaurora vandensis]|uniref:acyltransferase domain-containing protein n=1 Tax=Candidatus Cyanaurora vandensis TaxID=2714958 RepID=UPI00257F87F6|nr:acyltransferase domain-containing protein [Candidatus Cyanaurora vandensis]